MDRWDTTQKEKNRLFNLFQWCPKVICIMSEASEALWPHQPSISGQSDPKVSLLKASQRPSKVK